MVKLIAILSACLLAAIGLSWLADRPGNIILNWEGYRVDVTVFRAVVALGILMLLSLVGWSILRTIWQTPAVVGQYFKRRRQSRGLEALSSGMIAIGSGDHDGAMRHAIQARKALPNEPLTHLLRAQAAQLTDDRATSRRIYEGMLGSPDTEALGLRGLYIEAHKEGESEAARQFAERALRLNPKLSWASDALFDMQCKLSDWRGALETLASARKNGLIEKPAADRKRAVLLTAQAQRAEDHQPDKALSLAQEAHGLAHDLIPAADIAGRLLASRGNTSKAAKVLEQTWKSAPHPDIAMTYAFARPGDSPRDRLTRVMTLAKTTPHTIEAPIAVANAAIEARAWDTARDALAPLLENRLTQRVCTLMAQIEGEQHGDTGRVREWLARAVNAPRDPAWTADGVVSDEWGPVSPVTGELDAFRWRVPVESAESKDRALVTQNVEKLVALGTRSETVVEGAVPATAAPVIDASLVGKQQAPGATPTKANMAASAAAAAVTIKTSPDVQDSDSSEKDADDVVIIKHVDATAVDATAKDPLTEPSSSPETSSKPVSNKASAAITKPIPASWAPIAEKPQPSQKNETKADRPKPESRKPAAPKTGSSGGGPDNADTAKTDRTAPAGNAAEKAKIYVAPRAPDDPGAEGPGIEDARQSPMSRLRN